MRHTRDKFSVGMQVLIALVLMVTFLPNKFLIELNPHPFFIVILYGALAAGTWIGVFTGLISSLLYFGLMFYAAGFSFNSAAFSFEGFNEFLKVDPTIYIGQLMFLVVGFIVGEIKEFWQRRLQSLQEQVQSAQQEAKENTSRLQQTEQVLIELQGRVLGQTETMSRLYHIARSLSDLSIEKIFNGLMQLLEDLLQVEQASLYRLDEIGRSAQLVIWKGDPVWPHLIELEHNKLWQEAISSRGVASFVDFEQRPAPIYMVPIHYSGRVSAMIVVHRLPRIKVNADSRKLLSIIAEWTGASMKQAYTLEEAAAFKSSQLTIRGKTAVMT